eukprot:628835-Rhodomonas_salina.1
MSLAPTVVEVSTLIVSSAQSTELATPMIQHANTLQGASLPKETSTSCADFTGRNLATVVPAVDVVSPAV